MTRFVFSAEVEEAKASGRAIVALESTVISHGLPYPENVKLAASLESIVRESGAVPATIAIEGGRIRVGIGEDLLFRLGTEKGVAKVSLRDMALVLADGTLGATTVASTMFAAERAGIRVFATGGIGGVHPGDGSDVSADLPALARFRVAVVASGPKAILDVRRTREWLETWGVPILGLGTSELPLFYTVKSGIAVDRCVPDESAAARYVNAHLAMGQGGILLASPVPAAFALDAAEVSDWIARAQKDADERGVIGHALTPFLLAELGRRSQGQTLRANLGLLRNNARVAARLAMHVHTQM